MGLPLSSAIKRSEKVKKIETFNLKKMFAERETSLNETDIKKIFINDKRRYHFVISSFN